MSFLLFLAGAAIQPVTADSAVARRLLDRLPDVTEEETTAARLRFFFAPNGRILECELLQYAGSQHVADGFCDRLIGARYIPARDETGERAHGMFPIHITVFPDRRSEMQHRVNESLYRNPLPPDFVVSVEALPQDLAENPRVRIYARIDETGAFAFCEPARDQKEELAEVACGEARAVRLDAKRSREGEPVQYVTELMVEFRVES